LPQIEAVTWRCEAGRGVESLHALICSHQLQASGLDNFREPSARSSVVRELAGSPSGDSSCVRSDRLTC